MGQSIGNMMNKGADYKITIKMKKAGRGALFFAENFISYGSPEAVKKALQRLTNSGEIDRIATGIYTRPVIDDIIGKVTPGLEEIARAIAKRDKARIIPTGSYAMNRLGLSTQVPVNVVFLTDGSARRIKIGQRSILFKKVSPKNVAAVGEISGLVIQALKTIGKNAVTEQEIKHIQTVLKNEKPTRLAHDIRLAPSWIREIMKPILKSIQDDQQHPKRVAQAKPPNPREHLSGSGRKKIPVRVFH